MTEPKATAAELAKIGDVWCPVCLAWHPHVTQERLDAIAAELARLSEVEKLLIRLVDNDRHFCPAMDVDGLAEAAMHEYLEIIDAARSALSGT